MITMSSEAWAGIMGTVMILVIAIVGAVFKRFSENDRRHEAAAHTQGNHDRRIAVLEDARKEQSAFNTRLETKVEGIDSKIDAVKSGQDRLIGALESRVK